MLSGCDALLSRDEIQLVYVFDAVHNAKGMTDSPESEYESESGDEAVDEPMSRKHGFYTIGRSKFGALYNYPWNAPGVFNVEKTVSPPGWRAIRRVHHWAGATDASNVRRRTSTASMQSNT